LRVRETILGCGVLALLFAGIGQAWEPDETTATMVNKFLEATKIQQQALRGAQMEADIDAQIPKLKEQGKWKMLRKISELGKITYSKLGDFVGDKTVQHEVIARYIQMETGGDTPQGQSIAITPENYKFRLKTKMTAGAQRIYVFELTPRRKAVGLFKGELWLDGATGMPIKESGTLVKNPSIFIKSMAFVNEFSIHDGVAWPSRVICHVDTHLAGRADLDVHFGDPTRIPNDEASPEITDAP